MSLGTLRSEGWGEGVRAAAAGEVSGNFLWFGNLFLERDLHSSPMRLTGSRGQNRDEPSHSRAGQTGLRPGSRRCRLNAEQLRRGRCGWGLGVSPERRFWKRGTQHPGKGWRRGRALSAEAPVGISGHRGPAALRPLSLDPRGLAQGAVTVPDPSSGSVARVFRDKARSQCHPGQPRAGRSWFLTV